METGGSTGIRTLAHFIWTAKGKEMKEIAL
jgi:hypothetical protein